MGEQIGPENLRQILQQATTPSSYQGVVGAGSTTTAVVDAVGGWGANQWARWGIQFTDTTTTAALRGVWQQITGNTSNTLTLAAPLPTAPAAGDTYNIRAFGTQVQNVAEWGSVAVEAADATGVVPFRLPYSEAAPGAAAPARAVQVAGSDGSNLRTIAVDIQGRATPQPPALVWDAAGLSLVANTNAFATSYTPPVAGRLSVTVGIDTATTAPHVVLVKTANTAPTGGSAGTRTFQLLNGTTLAQGLIAALALDATPNDTYNLQVDQAATIDVTATFRQGQGS